MSHDAIIVVLDRLVDMIKYPAFLVIIAGLGLQLWLWWKLITSKGWRQ